MYLRTLSLKSLSSEEESPPGLRPEEPTPSLNFNSAAEEPLGSTKGTRSGDGLLNTKLFSNSGYRYEVGKEV